jgi:glycosyltransferase involved in cell wall biosynthesis
MRLLHVHDFFAPGNSRYGFDMNRLLVRRGHEVHVLAATGGRGPADGAVVEGVRFHTYPHRPELSAARRLDYARTRNEDRFGELHARHPFDLLVFNQPVCASGVTRHPAAEPLPKVYWFISPWAAEWKASNPEAHFAARLFHTSLRNRMEDRMLRACDAVLVESEFIRAQLREHHRKVPPGRVSLVPGAVDLERFRPDGSREEARARLGIGPGPVVLTVRRLVERMGIDLLIRAVAEVPELRLLVGGEGPLRGDLEALARSLGVQARFLGHVEDAVLPDYYRAADLLVLPTRELEGFGLVAIEAMACGTPAMGTPVGALPEVLGPLGLLFEEASPRAIAAGLRRHFACRDPGLERRCLEHVRTRYDWARVIDGVERLFGQVIDARARHGRR